MIDLRQVDVGDIVANRYRILRILGSGGMAMVYEAEHQLTGRRCALKMIHSHLARRPELTSLFLKEAKVGSTIGHNPHIVEVFDADHDVARGIPFLAMELLEGETVEQRLNQRGPFEHAQAVQLLLQLSDAFTQAHERGVVHRDLKVSNLFLAHERNAATILKVLDFGIAKVLSEEAQRTATQIGTPFYLAPEQMGAGLRTLAAKEGIHIATGVSTRTDIWGLGLVAYEMLTGISAAEYWDAEVSADLFLRVVLNPLEPPSKRAGTQAKLLPPGFDGWFERSMQKDAAARWETFSDAVAELTRLLASTQSTSAAPVKTVVQTVLASELFESSSALPHTQVATRLYEPSTALATSVAGVKSAAGTRRPRTKWLILAGAMALLSAAAYLSVMRYLFQPSEQLCATLPVGQDKFNACQAACEAGNAVCCNDLGKIYEAGQGIGTKDDIRAIELYERSCRAGIVLGCRNFESMYSKGLGNSINARLAIELRQKACDSGEMKGCSNLGVMYENGTGFDKKDNARARELYQRACEAGEVSACSRLAHLYARSSELDKTVNQRVTKAFQKACDGGDAAICLDLGWRYETGAGAAEKDEKRAAALYKQACDGGQMKGCMHLGAMYKIGAGVDKKDAKRAAVLYQEACDGGEVISCNNLADMYLKGTGVEKRDEARAVELFQKACMGGEKTSCSNLGGLYLNGTGAVAKDETRAVEFLKKACDLGANDACSKEHQLAGHPL